MLSFRMYEQFSEGFITYFFQFIQRDLPIYIPTTSVGKFRLLYIHVNIFFLVFKILK